jgi:hypothetical protein
MDMPNSVKHMNKKAQVMRELFHTCICGQNTCEARVWTYKRQYGPPLHTITPVHVVSEQAILERFAEEIRNTRPFIQCCCNAGAAFYARCGTGARPRS